MTHPFAYVAKVFPRTSETFVINELRQLEQLGETPIVFSLHRNPSPVSHAILEELRAPIVYVEDLVVSDEDLRRAADRLASDLGIGKEDRGRYMPRKYVRLAVAMQRLCEMHEVRHLHAHFASRSGHVAALAAALLGASYSLTAHAKDIYHRDVDRELLAWKVCRARFAVTVTEYNLDYLRTLLSSQRTPSSSLVRLYNGVDLERFRMATAERLHPPHILSIGRLVEKKGFDVLIDACAILRDRGTEFRCEILGGGELEGALRERVRDRALEHRVVLVGSVSTEVVTARLAGASIVALPCVVASDGNVDALPTALLEGMACGLPLVSTRLSGIPEIIEDGRTGLLVEPGDAVALADALQSLISDPARAAAMGRAGRKRADERFDLRANVSRLRDMLRDACAAGTDTARKTFA